MNNFPDYLHPSKKDAFADQLLKEYTSTFRQEVKIYLLRQKETDFIDLVRFNRLHPNDMAITRQIVKIVSDELTELGWHPFLGFGDTGLYVLSSPEKPSGVY